MDYIIGFIIGLITMYYGFVKIFKDQIITQEEYQNEISELKDSLKTWMKYCDYYAKELIRKNETR
jgi:uncharacterized membrane-anchored protein YhcB (DUF1043 family)